MPQNHHRFSEVFAQTQTGKPSYNQVLADLGAAVLVPTLGSVVPNWLLLVPKAPSLNFRIWQEAESMDVITLVKAATKQLGVQLSDVRSHGTNWLS